MLEGKIFLPSEAEGLKLTDGFDILDSLINHIGEAREWYRIQREDRLILEEKEALENQLAEIGGTVGKETAERLQETIIRYVCAYCDAAILYGLRTAVKLLYAFERPLEMSHYISERNARRRAEASK